LRTDLRLALDRVAALERVVEAARWADVVWMAWKTGERDDAGLDVAQRSLNRALVAATPDTASDEVKRG